MEQTRLLWPGVPVEAWQQVTLKTDSSLGLFPSAMPASRQQLEQLRAGSPSSASEAAGTLPVAMGVCPCLGFPLL